MDADADLRRIANPITLPPEETVTNAAREMHDQQLGAVLVTETDGTLLGIFTGRDAISRVLAGGLDPYKTSLGEVMSYNPVTIHFPATTEDALSIMRQTYCRHLPIIDNAGKVVGLLSRGDFRGRTP